MKPLHDMNVGDDHKKGLQNVCSLIGACSLYPCPLHNFTYSSASLGDLIKKTQQGGGRFSEIE